jgi:HTH-type transcriptional regulator/antitoxin HipB
MDKIARTTKYLGQALRTARNAKGLTQVKLAARAGIWQRTVSNIETGASGTQV